MNHTSQNPRTPLPGLLTGGKELMLAELHDRLADAGFPDVRPGHGCVFRFLGEDGMRLTELAGLAEVTKQTCGEIVDDAERLGYVERAPDPNDRRAKVIQLTEKGCGCQAAGREIFAEIEREWAERYGSERVAAMRELLEEIEAGERDRAAQPAGTGAATSSSS